MNGNEHLFQNKMNLGHSAAWEQAWETAEAYYREALSIIPDNITALVNLGLALFESGKLGEAAKYYQQAAKQNPEDPLATEKLAQIYEQMGKPDLAAKYAFYSGDLYLKLREVNRAIENWIIVTRNTPADQQAHSRLAMIYERIGQKQQAVRELLIMAGIYQRNNDIEKSRQSIEQALQLIPENQEAHKALQMVKSGDLLPLPAGKTTSVEYKSAQATLETHTKPGVEEPGEQLDPIEETHALAMQNLAAYLFDDIDLATDSEDRPARRGGFQALVEGARSLISKPVDPTRIALHLGQAFEFHTSQNYQQAAEELERAVNAGLNHAGAYFELGYLRARSEHLESAVRSLQRAMNHQDYAIGARLLLATLYRKLNRIKDASLEYMHALRIADARLSPEVSEKDINQLYEPVIESIIQENNTEVLGQISQAIYDLLLRSDWRITLEKARDQLTTQSDGQLLPLSEIVTQTGSSYLVESLSRLTQLARDGHIRSAMEEAYFVLQYTPNYLPLHVYMGDMLIKQGMHNEAMTKYISTARAYEMRREPERAINVYRRVIELTPMIASPRLHLISQLIDIGKIDQALTEYLDLAEVYYHLADLDNARDTYMVALQLVDQSSTPTEWQIRILHQIADIDLQSLNWRRAIQLFEQICRINPDDEKARFQLVGLHRRLNQINQANETLDHYLTHLQLKTKRTQAIRFIENLLKDYPDWDTLHNRLERIKRKTA